MKRPHNPYPRTKKNGELSYKHRDMAALKLGRRLEPGETVHHVNGDKTDFHPENLIVFSSHRRLLQPVPHLPLLQPRDEQLPSVPGEALSPICTCSQHHVIELVEVVLPLVAPPQ